MSNPVAEIFDVFFNGRSAAEATGATNPGKPAVPVTLEELVRRKTSIVRLGRKYYEIVAVEIENPKQEATSE